MSIIYHRARGVKECSAKRWSDIPADHEMSNLVTFPLEFAGMTVTVKDGAILKGGCGDRCILQKRARARVSFCADDMRRRLHDWFADRRGKFLSATGRPFPDQFCNISVLLTREPV